MSFSTRHLDRSRANSFGSVAEQYDRFRPTFPDVLMDRLAALHPQQVLEVGCGTGKAAISLSVRGLSVLGVEPDPRMAEIARRNGISVEVARFEDWDSGGRRFDLITCADAWHWIDPTIGRARARELLAPGGSIARFWTFHELSPDVLNAFAPVYAKHAPSATVGGTVPKSTAAVPDPFADDPQFVADIPETLWWSLTLTAEDWTGLVSTFSDHQMLSAGARAALLAGLRDVIDARGGTVQTKSGTFVQVARCI